MSQHSSLKSDSVGARHRNVLKRHERIRSLQDADTWGSRQSAFKLPKVKLIKLKVKKSKGGKEAGEAPAEGAAGTPQVVVEAAAKPAQKPAAKPAVEKAKGKEK